MLTSLRWMTGVDRSMSRKPFSACAILLHAYTLHAKDNTFRPVTRYAK
jgi:hypothetical protein